MISKLSSLLMTSITFLSKELCWYLTSYQESVEGDLQLGGEKLIVFDFDGTLCNSFHEAISIFNEISADYGLTSIKDSEQEAYRSMPPHDFLKQHGVTTVKLPFVAYRMKKLLKQRVENLTSFDGMRELIQKIKSRGYRIGILTSNSLENVHLFLKAHKFEGIDFIYHGSPIFGKDKLLNKIRSKSKTNAMIYVGDEIRDIEACQKARFPIISVTWGYNTRELLEKYNPNYIVDSPQEILTIVSK